MKPLRWAAIVACAVWTSGCSRPAQPAAAAPAAAPAPSIDRSQPATVTGKAAPGTIVLLEPADGTVPHPEGPAVMDQIGKAFVPALLVARVSQPVEFRNSEDMLHNVHVTRRPTGTAVLSVATPPFEMHPYSFSQTGQYDVSCDIHPGMLAMIVVAATPWVAKVDDHGVFELANVPPGAYRLKTTTSGRETERLVQIVGPHTDLK